jgi:hypothetical protein
MQRRGIFAAIMTALGMGTAPSEAAVPDTISQLCTEFEALRKEMRAIRLSSAA